MKYIQILSILYVVLCLPLTAQEISGGGGGGSFDATAYGDATWGSGSAFTWTFDAGATDPVLDFGSASAIYSGGTLKFTLPLDTNAFIIENTSMTELLGISTFGDVRLNRGSLTNPGVVFVGDTDTGFGGDGLNKLGVVAGNVNVATFGGDQDLLVFDATASTGDTELVIKEGAGQSSAALQVTDNSDGALFSVNVGGGFGGPGRALSSLGTPANGTIEYCTDCLKGSDPCSASSTGAMAMRVNGAWQCL